jgi:hypothetical protein
MADDFKRLYQGQLPNSAGVLYTVPGGTQAIVKRITVVNTDAVDHTFQLFQGGSAAANAITPVFTVLAGGMAENDDSRTMDSADTIYGVADVASKVTVTIAGDEVTA